LWQLKILKRALHPPESIRSQKLQAMLSTFAKQTQSYFIKQKAETDGNKIKE